MHAKGHTTFWRCTHTPQLHELLNKRVVPEQSSTHVRLHATSDVRHSDVLVVKLVWFLAGKMSFALTIEMTMTAISFAAFDPLVLETSLNKQGGQLWQSS